MRSIKGSMAVAVMSAFFASHGAAAGSLEECKGDIGWATWVGGGSPTGTAAAIKANGASSPSSQFFNTRKLVDSCPVPKNLRNAIESAYEVKFEMTQDECSLYNAVASADAKFNVGKFADAEKIMRALATKAHTLAGDGKLSTTAATQIADQASKAAACLGGL